MRSEYKQWLEAQKYDDGTVTAQLHRTGRVEKCYGDLVAHYKKDQFEELLRELTYSAEDERRRRPNPSKIPFNGDPRKNLASYKNALALYGRFLGNQDGNDFSTSNTLILENEQIEDVAGQRIGLERDLQSTLRQALDQLEPGLVAIDDGTERSVQSGFIDITARAADDTIVVIELKAGTAGQRAVGQILSYMGDIAVEEPEANLRGILITADFDAKAKAAARMVPSLTLQKYSVKFSFAVSE